MAVDVEYIKSRCYGGREIVEKNGSSWYHKGGRSEVEVGLFSGFIRSMTSESGIIPRAKGS